MCVDSTHAFRVCDAMMGRKRRTTTRGARNSRCKDSGGTDPSVAKIMNARLKIESTYSSPSSNSSFVTRRRFAISLCCWRNNDFVVDGQMKLSPREYIHSLTQCTLPYTQYTHIVMWWSAKLTALEHSTLAWYTHRLDVAAAKQTKSSPCLSYSCRARETTDVRTDTPSNIYIYHIYRINGKKENIRSPNTQSQSVPNRPTQGARARNRTYMSETHAC